MTDFYAAAQAMYTEHGWISQPLVLDGNGKPKRPIVKGWQNLTSIDGLPWARAMGLGIVLGPASNNLAVIDVDDNEMANAVFALMVRQHARARMVRTFSNNLHVYFKEKQPSASTVFKVRWRERDIGIELKAKGTQATAPPTTGYEPVGIEAHLDDIEEVPSLRAVWEPIAAKLGIEMPSPTARPNAGYPTPWQSEVPAGERNKSMYIEAHQLKRAGIEVDEALALLQTRWASSYVQGESTWDEMVVTIVSAFTKAEATEGRIEWALQ